MILLSCEHTLYTNIVELVQWGGEKMRVTRTVRDFQNALLTLLEKNSFDHLTVDQICNEALLHRSSFYRYFNDKYDLLEQTMVAQISQIADSGDSEEDVIKQFVRYIDEHKAIIRHLAASNSHTSLYSEILQIFSQVILDRSKQTNSTDPVIIALQHSKNPEMMAYILSGSIIGAFYWWQKNNYNVSTDELISFAKQSVLSLAK